MKQLTILILFSLVVVTTQAQLKVDSNNYIARKKGNEDFQSKGRVKF